MHSRFIWIKTGPVHFDGSNFYDLFSGTITSFNQLSTYSRGWGSFSPLGSRLVRDRKKWVMGCVVLSMHAPQVKIPYPNFISYLPQVESYEVNKMGWVGSSLVRNSLYRYFKIIIILKNKLRSNQVRFKMGHAHFGYFFRIYTHPGF